MEQHTDLENTKTTSNGHCTPAAEKPLIEVNKETNNNETNGNETNEYYLKMMDPEFDNRKDGLLTIDQIPELMKEPYIATGYRKINRPWSYYMKTLCSVHNDTGNVWTHLPAPIIIFSLYFYFYPQPQLPVDLPTQGILLFTIGSSLALLLSAVAHWLHAKSAFHHYFFFVWDYIGISTYGYTYGLMMYHCSGTTLFYTIVGRLFLIFQTLFPICITINNSLGRMYYKKACWQRKVLQAGSVSISVFFCEVITCFRLYDYYTNYSYPVIHHAFHLVFSMTNLFFYVSRVPERFFVGKFDTWGHSHQIFHISVLLCALSQMYACHQDLKYTPADVLAMANSHTLYLWGGLAGFLLIQCLIPLVFYTKMKRISRQ